MQNIITPEQESMITDIIENCTWKLAPSQVCFINELNGILENTEDEFKIYIIDLITVLKIIPYSEVKEIINSIIINNAER